MSEPTPSSQPSQRDAGGRFLPNNTGGPGNPFARQVAQLRKALLVAVGPDDITAIVDRLKTKALDGDLAAIKILFGYVLGKPTPMPDPDAVENKEQKEQERLETLLGRIILPVIRRGCIPEAEEPPQEPAVPSAPSAVPAAPPPPADSPAVPATKLAPSAAPSSSVDGPQQPARPAPSGVKWGDQPAPERIPSTNRRPATSGPFRHGRGILAPRGQQTDVLDGKLKTDEPPMRLGCEVVDLAILGARSG